MYLHKARTLIRVLLLALGVGVFVSISAFTNLTGPTAMLSPQNIALTPTPTPVLVSTGIVSMTVSVEPQHTTLDQRFTVSIKLQGDSRHCGQSIVVKPVDVYQVLDHSGSMGDNDKMTRARQAAIAFLNEMDFSVDRVGVVQFDNVAQVLQNLSKNPQEIQNAIESIGIGGGTDVAAGLSAAYNALREERRQDAVPVIIVLSDGQSSPSEIMHAANTAKADGIVVVSIGLGSDVDEEAMKSMASLDVDGNPLYYFAPDPSQLQGIYQSIARSIRKYSLASHVSVQFQTNVYDFLIIPDSLAPSGTVTGDTATWQQPMLDDGTTVFTFQAQGRKAGTNSVGQIVTAAFLECEQDARELEIFNAPVVELTQVVDPPPASLLCERWRTYPWWGLAPLALLAILGTFLLSPPGRDLFHKVQSRPLSCKASSILLLLFLLTLATLLAKALIGDLCPNDTLYFWKLTTNGEVGVYQTRFSGDSITEVSRLNQGSNCAACHQASSTRLIAAVRTAHNGDVVIIRYNGNTIPLPTIHASYLAWSPDGKKLAISYNDTDIYILDLTTEELTPLEGASEPDIVETMPAWSPDGTTIAFVRASRTAPPPQSAEIDVPCDIYTVPAAGGQSLPLPGASGDGFNYYPAYSPDGKWLAFTRHTQGTDTYADESADIYILPATGAPAPIRLNVNSEHSDSWPSWSPDSKWLGFSTNRRDGQFDILVAPIGPNGLTYEIQYDNAGHRSNVFKISGAALPQDEEFHPVWIRRATLNERLHALWPWFLPLIVLPLVPWHFCRERKYTVWVEVVDGITGQPIDNADIQLWNKEEQDGR